MINELKGVFREWESLLVEADVGGLVKKISGQIVAHGGVPYIVGGAVRDGLMPDAPESKDIDFVVQGLELDKLARILKHLGQVDLVGKSFGVLKLTMDGFDFDIAIPRTAETKTGDGHQDFQVTTDVNASIEDDLGRRDFTFNAIAKSPTGDLIDPYGGAADLRNKVVRAVGDPIERFQEDPLRILRAIQFATRFGFTIHPQTAMAIKSNVNKLLSVSKERVLMEFEKAWTKGLADMNVLTKLLHELGIGRFLFGASFDPIPLEMKSTDAEEKRKALFIAFFINGGKFENMKPDNELKLLVTLAKMVREEVPIWEWGKKHHRDHLKFIADVFELLAVPAQNQAFERQGAALKEKLKKPIDPKELSISGLDLKEPDIGLYGPALGDMLKRVLQAVQEGQLKNNKVEIIEFVKKNL